MKEVMYRQCTLQKREGRAVLTRVLWGPESFAVVDRIVRVEEDDGKWTTGWRVVAVHGDAIPERYARHMSHAHTRQRKASDI